MIHFPIADYEQIIPMNLHNMQKKSFEDIDEQFWRLQYKTGGLRMMQYIFTLLHGLQPDF
jgi:hypothetical protein